MSNKLTLSIGTVKEVENTYSKDGSDGLRIRVELPLDKTNNNNDLPWVFPMLPKTFQSIPKVGEMVFVLCTDDANSQRYYFGPIISQQQFNTYCGGKTAKSLLKTRDEIPLEKISNYSDTVGAFPKSDDVAVVGRGSEDVILRYDGNTKASEIQLRAGVRSEPTNSLDKNMIGNIIFNGIDPAYIQLKYKNGLSTLNGNGANSVINLVANKINLISNKDDNVAHNLQDKDSMISDEKQDEVIQGLHPLAKGDKLVELLNLLKGCILNHVHPWAGMKQCGDWEGYINELNKFDIDSILSDYVRIS